MDTMPLKTLNTLLRVVVEQGYPLDQVLEEIGLDFNPLLPEHQPHAEVPTRCYSKLYRLLMELLQDEAFGLGQEYHAPPGTFRMMCLFIIHCPTLHEALLRSREFYDYCNQYRGIPRPRDSRTIEYLDDGESALCIFLRPVPSNEDRNFIGDVNVLLMMFRFYSWLIDKPLPLQAAHLRAREPVSSRRYEKLFGAPVRFDQPDAGLVIPAGVLQYPVAQSERSLREFLRQAPYPLVKQEQPGRVQNTSQRVEQLLNRHNSMKLPNADTVAGQLNMSARTLHRKLAAEGASFQALKDNFRAELAVQYVSRPELSFDAVATLMGFHDNSAFYRSFKKWTGVSPGQFRRELGANETDSV